MIRGFQGAVHDLLRSGQIQPEDHDRVQSLINEMQKSGKLAVFEGTGLRSDNSRFDLETRATLIPNVDGGEPSVLTLTTDITQRKLAEKALKASQEQLRLTPTRPTSTAGSPTGRVMYCSSPDTICMSLARSNRGATRQTASMRSLVSEFLETPWALWHLFRLGSVHPAR